LFQSTRGFAHEESRAATISLKMGKRRASSREASRTPRHFHPPTRGI
jgi:hypothetical protein